MTTSVPVETTVRSELIENTRDRLVRQVHTRVRHWGRHAGENMCTNENLLETRIVILEAALDWVRHEATSRRNDRQSMTRIAAIATQVLEDEGTTMKRRRAYLRAG